MKKESYVKHLISKQIEKLNSYLNLLNNWIIHLDNKKIKNLPFITEEKKLKDKIQNYETILITFKYASIKDIIGDIDKRSKLINSIEKRSIELQNKLDTKQNEIQNELGKLKTKGRTKSLKSKWVEPSFIDFNV